MRTVQVPIWSEVDGQDDIRWYEAVRQTNGRYKVTVQVDNHNYSTGIYNVHLYYIQNDGSQIGVGGTQTNVTLSEPKADLAITGLNNATGSYDVVISNLIAPRGFKEVLVPTWSEKNGQDDIIWYNEQGGRRPHAAASYAMLSGSRSAVLPNPYTAQEAAAAA